MGTVRATIYDGTGGTALASFVADAPGAALSFCWASASGQQTRIALRDDGGASYTYELTSSYTQVADPYEPNDGMDAAAPMPDGGQMSAFLFAGRRGGTNDPAAYDDYYRFTAQPGALSIRLDDVPGDLAARLFLFRADGSEVARVSNGMRGAALALNPPAVTDATDFVVRVSLWDEAPAAAGRGGRAAGELHAALPADGVASAAVRRGSENPWTRSIWNRVTGGAKAASAAKSGRGCRACSSSFVAKIIERS